MCGLRHWVVSLTISLGRPRPLELSAANELVARDNLDVLRQNGFDIQLDGEDEGPLFSDQGGEEDNTPVRRGLKLVAQPTSKNVVFDMKGLPQHIIHALLT